MIYTMTNFSVKKLPVILVLLLGARMGLAQADAGDDKAICSSGSVEIGTDMDPSWCYFWEDDKGNKSFPATPKITVNPASTTTYTVTVTGPDFSFKDKDDVKVTVIKSIKIKEVTFSGGNVPVVKDNGASYSVPHWKDGSPPSPVCYKAGDVMQLAGKIELDEDPGAGVKIKVKMKGTDGYDINETSVPAGGKTISLPATAVVKALPAHVEFYDPFEAEWEISFDDGSTWCAAGKSSNQLYSTWKAPAGGVTMFHTTIHLSCKNAKGQSAESSIFSGVWSEFTDRSVSKVGGGQLTYYNNWQNVNTTTASLLANGDGQCGSWASLLLDMLKVHGIDHPNEYVLVRHTSSGGFFVKNVTFAATGNSGIAAYPYLNLAGAGLVGINSYTWVYAEVNDAAGIAGQGTANPAALFNNHQFITFGGKFYDPSYGTEAATLDDVDNNGIGGYFESSPVFVSEAVLNVDVNGDGDKTDSGMTTGITFKKNAAALDITATYIDY